jgi:hypothetical protein
MAAELVNELKVLRKGRGLYASRIADRVGPAIRGVSGVVDDDAPGVIRRKVTDWLDQLADALPTDLRIALRAAFAIGPEVRLPLYQERVEWTASHLERDPRTVRRRIDEAIEHVAQLATAGTLPPRAGAVETGWHTAELRMMLVLDRARPEAVEQRRIVSDQDDLTELDLAVTLAVVSSDPAPEVAVFYGGTLADRGMESSERRAFALELPRPLARGESHDFAVHYRLSGEEAMRPHVVCVPKRPCTLFDLRVRFDRARLPSRLWLLRGVFQRDISDPVRRGDMPEVDEAGEIHLAFHDLTPGLAYGVRWDPAS